MAKVAIRFNRKNFSSVICTALLVKFSHGLISVVDPS